MNKQKGFAPLLVIAVVVIFALIVLGSGVLIGYQAAAPSDVDPQYSYKINLYDPQVTGPYKEGGEFTVSVKALNNFDEQKTLLFRASLEPSERYSPEQFVPATVISGSVCCNGRRSEATQYVTLASKEQKDITFKVRVPNEGDTATCNGYTTSYYSPSRVYYVKITVYNKCYGGLIEDLKPFKITVQPGAKLPEINYISPDKSYGNMYLNYYYPPELKVDGRSCTDESSGGRMVFRCPYGNTLDVRHSLKNAGNQHIQFLSEAIIHPAENYDPFGIMASFTEATKKSCCGDTFSYGKWIKANAGTIDSVAYKIKIPHSTVIGKCSGRDYFSPSQQYYLKVSAYTDCGGMQIQDMQPILIAFQ